MTQVLNVTPGDAITLRPLDPDGMAKAQRLVTAHHYLHRPVDPRTSPEGYTVHLHGPGSDHTIGVLIFGRPEATVCRPFYGSLVDLAAGRVELSRWQVLNLARVWLDPLVQAGGGLYHPWLLPGFRDRRGVWHSTLASTVIRMALERVGHDYLVHRPPCFLNEPYLIRSVLSYCQPEYHKGTIYRATGFRLERVNRRGLQTWRIDIPALTAAQDAEIRRLAQHHPRSIAFRTARAAAQAAPAQLSFAEPLTLEGA